MGARGRWAARRREGRWARGAVFTCAEGSAQLTAAAAGASFFKEPLRRLPLAAPRPRHGGAGPERAARTHCLCPTPGGRRRTEAVSSRPRAALRRQTVPSPQPERRAAALFRAPRGAARPRRPPERRGPRRRRDGPGGSATATERGVGRGRAPRARPGAAPPPRRGGRGGSAAAAGAARSARACRPGPAPRHRPHRSRPRSPQSGAAPGRCCRCPARLSPVPARADRVPPALGPRGGFGHGTPPRPPCSERGPFRAAPLSRGDRTPFVTQHGLNEAPTAGLQSPPFE